MCDDWDELKEALRLLGTNKLTYHLRTPKSVDYALSTLDDDQNIDKESVHISLITMRGEKVSFTHFYPCGVDQINDAVYEAYKK